MSHNLDIWDKLKDVPKQAQKAIRGGRLSGMTDISPQWRYHVMTETFGPCGIGWKYEVLNKWLERGANDEVCGFADINLYVHDDNGWSDPIPGTGGASFVSKEWDKKNNAPKLYTSDEVYKMAVTDALSTAMKMLGVGAVIYSGGNDYSKYTSPKQEEHTPAQQPAQHLTKEQSEYKRICARLNSAQSDADVSKIMLEEEKAVKSLPQPGQDGINSLADARLAEFKAAANA